MPRPHKCRRIEGSPAATVYKPAGVPRCSLEEIIITLDEFEAMRLADYEGLYQEDAAARMNVSRQTFGNIIDGAHRKVADCLVNGKALRIEGGNVEIDNRLFSCMACSHEWMLPYGTGRPDSCPACGGLDFRRIDKGGGRGKCGQGRPGERCGKKGGDK